MLRTVKKRREGKAVTYARIIAWCKAFRAYSRWLTSLFRGRCAWLTMACSKTLPSLFATPSRARLKHFSTPRD
jgi:hypothetical protein